MPAYPVYLCTLSMFHCNGWCFPWSVVAMAGTHVCLRAVDSALIYPTIVEHSVTHLCGAPTVRSQVVEGHIAGDPKTCEPVKKDGKTVGEIQVKSNTVMLGYLKDPKATREAFHGGWMHTGDIARSGGVSAR